MEPLVSILIPTYNRPHYFKQALKSALDQTYSNIEIVICDNSDNNLTEQIVKQYQAGPQGAKIRYVRNTYNIGPIANQQKCFELSEGEYINYLMDDDLFHPNKIEKMIDYFLRYEGITLVASCRKLIDASGKPKDTTKNKTYKKLYTKDTIVNGIELGNKILRLHRNRIGEPTVVLFRKKDLVEPFGVFAQKQAQYSVDVASWLNLLAKGNAVYLAEPLSSVRSHSQQLSRIPIGLLLAMGDWVNFINDAPQKGFLQNRM